MHNEVSKRICDKIRVFVLANYSMQGFDCKANTLRLNHDK